jgi:hypothetical protein
MRQTLHLVSLVPSLNGCQDPKKLGVASEWEKLCHNTIELPTLILPKVTWLEYIECG